MALTTRLTKKIFKFGFQARTSRGLMRDKNSWFVQINHSDSPGIIGIGECGPLPGLSIDAVPEYEDVLRSCLAKVAELHQPDLSLIADIVPPEFPSIRFGLETAFLDLANGGQRVIFDNSFIAGEPIPINGLVWIGDMDFMMNQINQKVALGFDCIKIKVGGLNFDRECDMLEYIRKRYFNKNITVRLDANGAFKLDDVLFRLDQLSKFNVHSIEQPIKPGQPEMEELCRKSPIPIAFDEELIGIHGTEEKRQLLESLRPAYIILKPTLHGGIISCREWIAIAESLGIGWWMTSALESNIGLNAICQLTAEYNITMHQGLGTGQIYDNNIESPLQVDKGMIRYVKDYAWDLDQLAH